MCKVLNLSRSTYYYESKAKNKDESQLIADIVEIFRRSRNNYGDPSAQGANEEAAPLRSEG